MTSCHFISRLLPDVADGEASAAEVARVEGHAAGCTVCRIALAREKRLGAALASMRQSVDEAFTVGVMRRVPPIVSTVPRGRRGLRLVAPGALLCAVLWTLRWVRGPWAADFPAPPFPPIAVPEIVEPAARGLLGLARSLLRAWQAITEAPWLSAALVADPNRLWLAGAAASGFLAAFGGCVLLLAAGVAARGRRPSFAA